MTAGGRSGVPPGISQRDKKEIPFSPNDNLGAGDTGLKSTKNRFFPRKGRQGSQHSAREGKEGAKEEEKKIRTTNETRRATHERKGKRGTEAKKGTIELNVNSAKITI